MGKCAWGFLVVASIVSELFGQCYSTGCIDKVSKLYVNSNGVTYIGMEGDETVANCTPVGGTFFTMNAGMVAYKEMYATLLAAKMASKPVFVRIVEGSANCTIAYVTLEQ